MYPNNYYYNYYVYEASSEGLFDAGLTLDRSYLSFSMFITIVLSLVALGLVLLTAILVKRARPLGIVAAVFQPIGLLAAYQTVTSYAAIDFSKLTVTVTGSSEDLAMSNLYDKLLSNFMEYILPQMMTYMFWAMLLATSTIITLIYAILLIKVKPKALAVVSMVLLIVRHFLITPVEPFGMFMGGSTQAMQSTWDIVFRAAFLIPPILIAILGIVNIGKTTSPEPKKNKK